MKNPIAFSLGLVCLVPVNSTFAQNAEKTAVQVLADPGIDFSRPGERAAAAAEMKLIGKARAAQARAKAQAMGLETRIKKPGGGLIELVDFEGDKPIYYETKNDDAAISTGADLLQTSPYNLDGSGLTVGVWDGGSIRTTHQEFSAGSRVVSQDGASLSNHGTHVGGTIGAAGVVARSKGMASNTRIDSYDWFSDSGEMIERAAFGPDQFESRIYLSNHSYGFINGWDGNRWRGNGTDQNAADYSFGQYSGTARTHDSIIYNSPYYISIWAAGNDGNDTPSTGSSVEISGSTVSYDPSIHPPGDGVYRNGFETIAAHGIGKNVLAIGAVRDAVTGGVRDPSQATLASFSSTGPSDDGRIKPDLVGNGWGLYSTFSGSDTSYGSFSGTSMAAPNVTGSAALVIDQYRRLFNAGMRASTLKGLLIHTATDRGNPGPDYKYGWGLVDAREAVDLVIEHHADPTKALIREDDLTTAQGSRTYTFDWDGSSALRATACWTDPPGSGTNAHDSRTARLVNDLNLKLVAPDGTEYFPFVMPFVGTWTTASMDQDATTGVNDRDNVEQVLIENPGQSGEWQIVVDHTGTLTDGEQVFSLIMSGVSGDPDLLALSSIAPFSGLRDTTQTLEVFGSGFDAGTSVKLTRAGEPDITGTSIVVDSPNELSCDFDLTGVALGDWNLVVTNPDPQSATLTDVFEVALTLEMVLDTSGLDWTSGGADPWFGQTAVTHDGVDAARSGAITGNQASTLSTTFTESGELTFYWKVSSESGSDFLRLFRNGTGLTGDLAPISGEVDWVQKTVPIPNGTTTVEWQYTKDGSGSAGDDAAWLDEVVFTPMGQPGIVVEQPVGNELVSGASTLDFGSHPVGDSSPATTVTIRNTGTAELTGLALAKSGSHSADFALGSLGTTTLAVGDSATFTVIFTPGAEGARSADLQILSNDPIQDPFEVSLTGTGLGPGSLAVSPSGDRASSGEPGGPFAPDSFQYTLSNPGGTAVDWTAAKTVDWLDISPTSGTLAALGETTVTLSFNANAEALNFGEYQDTITFTHVGSGEPAITRQVSLTVISLESALDTTGIAWSTGGNADWFAQTAVTHDGVDAAQSGAMTDSQSSALSTTLTGPGTLTFYWKVSSETNFDFLRFFLDGSEQTGALAPISGEVDWTQKTVDIPAGSHTVEWRYTKDFSVSNGTDAGWVDEVVYTLDSTPEIVVEQPVGTDLVDGAASVDFGFHDTGESSPPLTFTITNAGTADLTGLALSKSGPDAADFTLGSLGATTLAPGASTTFTVTYTTSGPGARSAALRIASNDEDENPFDITLTGTGPGELVVSPESDFASEGIVGGPFAPGSMDYVLSNPGGTAVDWTAAKTVDWIDISPTSGMLAAGADATVTVSININADSLNFGSYSDTVIFSNTSGSQADIVRQVSLDVIPPAQATGGAVSLINGHYVHVFDQVGGDTFQVIDGGTLEVEVLVVAGGGGGGSSTTFSTAGAGGGGAGGLVHAEAFPVNASAAVAVGNGGAGGGGGNTPGSNGADSSFSSLTALGGGGGSGGNMSGLDGGSGGGGRGSTGGAATQPSSASGGFGNKGGDWTSSGGDGAGGGGGAGQAAPSSPTEDPKVGGSGGDGLAFDISGTSTNYAGGGGGGGANDRAFGAGGSGGGGNGGNDGTPPTSGAPNTGGGGGGGNNSQTGADGGSGIVIVCYPATTLYQDWTAANDLNGGDALPGIILLPDGFANLQKFALGLDPAVVYLDPLEFVVGGELTAPGTPTLINMADPGQPDDERAVFTRRKDYATAGVTYTVEFSADLREWTASATAPTVLTDENSTQDHEVVSVPFPNTVPVQGGGQEQAPKFMRVVISDE